MAAQELGAQHATGLGIPGEGRGNRRGGEHEIGTVVLDDGGGTGTHAAGLGACLGEAARRKGQVVELYGAGCLRAHVLLHGLLDIGSHEQGLAHGVGGQRDVVIGAGGVVEHGAGVAGGKDIGVGLGAAGRECAHVLIGLDGAVGKGFELALEQIGAGKETGAHDGVVDIVFTGGGHDGDTGTALVQAELGDHLAQCELHAVLGVHGFDLLGDGRIEVFGERAIEAVDEGGAHPGLTELLDKLSADVSCADHGDRIRLHGVLLDGLAVVPVLAQHHTAIFKSLGQTGDGRGDGLGAGRDDELVKNVGRLLAAGEVARHERLAGDINGKHVVLHVHLRAELGESCGGGVEHAVGVAHVTADPQRDAAREERQGVVALEDVHGPVRVRGED